MTQLIPCPGCNRHVRQAETSCPFCATALSLGHIGPAALPRTRLGRAATFAFGATLVGATSLLACGGESEEKKPGAGGSNAGGTSSNAGSSAGGTNSSGGDQNFAGTGVVGPVYGAPAAGSAAIYGGPPIGGTGNEGGTGSSAGNTSGGTSAGGTGAPGPVYGAPTAGFSGVPLYGAAPAD